MKKLMIATMALVAGFAMADVESSNVVGYQQPTTLGDGEFAISTPTFVAVSGQYKISDIKVVGAENIGGVGGEFMQKMNADGSWGQTYYYLKEDGGADVPGWFKDGYAGEAVTDDDVLLPGEALIVTAEVGFGLQYAGQVATAEIPVTIPDAGFALAGNGTPVTVKISSIQIEGVDNIGGVGGEFIQKMNADGSWGQTYYYLKEDGGADVPGWFKDGYAGEAVTDDDALLPGESLVVTAEMGFTLKIPAAL